jgi:hypothetical protein
MPTDDALHVPAFRDGCYYGRPADCCWLCYCRLLASTVCRAVGS